MLDETTQPFGSVTEATDRIAMLISEITSSATEQASALSQMNGFLQETENVAQSNAGAAEEAAVASEELTGQAAMMKSFVGDLLAFVEGRGGAVGAAPLMAASRRTVAASQPAAPNMGLPSAPRSASRPEAKAATNAAENIKSFADHDFEDF